MEELQSRHRKEQRELQARITQKKKQANKKTRKGVNDECERLEAELKERQQAELAAVNGDDAEEPALNEHLDKLDLEPSKDEEAAPEPSPQNGVHDSEVRDVHDEQTNGTASQQKKPNRQKARLARRAAEQEEAARQAAEEAKNLPDLKQQEKERMLESMKERGLEEKEIRADGHCLYSAIADQLQQLEMPVSIVESTPDDTVPAYRTVRAVAADYIQQHREDFEPFLEEPLSDYLDKIRNTGEWGGQLELLALAKSYATDINVLQDFGRVEKIQSSDGSAAEKSMWLAYYKHGFGLGEHYNSLRKTP